MREGSKREMGRRAVERQVQVEVQVLALVLVGELVGLVIRVRPLLLVVQAPLTLLVRDFQSPPTRTRSGAPVQALAQARARSGPPLRCTLRVGGRLRFQKTW